MNQATRQYAAGETIITQGTTGDDFFILVSGRLSVIKDGVKLAELDVPGTVIGEISAILKIPRTATVITIEPTELIKMEGEMEQIIKQHPEVVLYILLDLAERLSNTTSDYTLSTTKLNYKTINRLFSSKSDAD